MTLDEICSHRRQSINLLVGPTVFDHYVLAPDIASLL